MKGLELSRLFYEQKGAQMLKEKFGDKTERIAVGLVGEGSECFGFDDEISRDHDWGPSFCLWINEEDYRLFGNELDKEYKALMAGSFMGYPPREEGAMSAGRVGVNEIKNFYRHYTGLDRAPSGINEWRMIPEDYIATVTNGEVFHDPSGEFTAIREGYLSYYPEDVRLKKLAAATARAAQAGQYNYPRALKRGDTIAAYRTLAIFIEKATHIMYLLNRRFMPYTKWAGRGLLEMGDQACLCHSLLCELTAEKRDPFEDVNFRRTDTVERICELIVTNLNSQGLTNHRDPYLLSHSAIIQSHISDENYKKLHIMAE